MDNNFALTKEYSYRVYRSGTFSGETNKIIDSSVDTVWQKYTSGSASNESYTSNDSIVHNIFFTGSLPTGYVTTQSTQTYSVRGTETTFRLGAIGGVFSLITNRITIAGGTFGYYFSLETDGNGAVTGTMGTVYESVDRADAVTFDPSTYQYLRIRESEGTVYWEYSADSDAWTIFAQESLLNSTNLDSYGSFYMYTYGNSASVQPTTFSIHDIIIKYSTGNLLGSIPNVTSDFTYTHNINSIGSSTEIDVALPADELPEYIALDNYVEVWLSYGSVGDQEPIQDHDGIDILDHNNLPIESVEITGRPFGIRKFSGYISRIRRAYGSSEGATITLLSHGADTDNYMLETGSFVELISQAVNSQYVTSFVNRRQSLTLTAGDTITYINILVQNTGSIINQRTLRLHDSNDQEILNVTIPVSGNAKEWANFVFSPYNVATTGTYYIYLGDTLQTTRYFGSNGGTNPYPGGALQTWNGSTWNSAGNDLAFVVGSNIRQQKVTFNSTEPEQIAINALTSGYNYTGEVSPGDIDTSDSIISYTFNTNTTAEVLDRVISLTPYNWWWSVDLANNRYNLKRLSTTVDHLLVLGVHLESLEITESIENLVNTVYFTGGEIAAETNLFIKRTNEASIQKYRPGLVKLSDNRVTVPDSAELIVRNELENYGDKRYSTSVVVSAGTYDIETIQVGQVIGFAGIENGQAPYGLRLQVQSIQYSPESVTLALDTLPRPVSKRLEDLNRNLTQTENQNNPNSAS